MSEEAPIDGVSALHGGVSLVNLSWNHQGSELAVFDCLGKVSILSVTINLCEFAVPKKCVLDSEDNLNDVVGLLWLNTDKPVNPFRSVQWAATMLTTPAFISSACTKEGRAVELLASTA